VSDHDQQILQHPISKSPMVNGAAKYTPGHHENTHQSSTWCSSSLSNPEQSSNNIHILSIVVSGLPQTGSSRRWRRQLVHCSVAIEGGTSGAIVNSFILNLLSLIALSVFPQSSRCSTGIELERLNMAQECSEKPKYEYNISTEST
jgi:hypothetical protein